MAEQIPIEPPHNSRTHKEEPPVRPGSLYHRLVTKYGEFWGGRILLSIAVILMLISLLVFLALVAFCAILVVNSSYLVSGFVNAFTLFLICIGTLIFSIRIAVSPTDNFTVFLNRYFSVQVSIGILAGIQTIFWVLQPGNENHEPRSVFLLTMSAALAYFRDQIMIGVGWVTSLSQKYEAENNPAPNPLPFITSETDP